MAEIGGIVGEMGAVNAKGESGGAAAGPGGLSTHPLCIEGECDSIIVLGVPSFCPESGAGIRARQGSSRWLIVFCMLSDKGQMKRYVLELEH